MERDLGHKFVVSLPLLEIFSVSINKNDDDGEGDRHFEVYGTIHVVDGRGTEALLYDRTPQDSENISQNQTLTLRSPHRCISALTSFTIDVDIKDRYNNLEISKGKICWGIQNDCYFDKCLSVCVPGTNGSAMVHCAVFSTAVEAAVKVVLMETCSRNVLSDADVYGTVIAYYGSKFDYSTSDQQRYFRITLFNKQPNDSVKLSPDDNSIPLTRSIVALPANSSLVIEANLFVRGSNVCDPKDLSVQGKTVEMRAAFMMKSDIQGQGLTARVNAEIHEPYRNIDFK